MRVLAFVIAHLWSYNARRFFFELRARIPRSNHREGEPGKLIDPLPLNRP